MQHLFYINLFGGPSLDIYSNPFFSIVIPVYNRAEQLLPTLHSCQSQTWQNFEVLVVDDGSDNPEDTETVVDSLNDDRFRCLHRMNGGGGAARNTGIDASVGDYIAFLDSDDLFEPNKLEVYLDKIRGDEIGDLVYYSYVYVDRGESRRWIRPSRPLGANESVAEYLFTYNEFIQTSTIVLLREVAESVRFDPSLKRGQDLDFCVRLQSAGMRFFHGGEAAEHMGGSE